MLHLLLQVGPLRYALAVSQVVEVLPCVHICPLPHAPPGVVGSFHYHGTPVSVIDLGQHLTGEPAPQRLSTRIIIVERPIAADKAAALGLPPARLGLLVARVLGTRALAPADFSRAHALEELGPGFSAIATDRHGLIYELDLNLLLATAAPESCARPTVTLLPCVSSPSKSY